MTTTVISIGNSNNKLTQNEWAHYAAAVQHLVERHATSTHFIGGSDWNAPWQNATWVIELLEGRDEAFRQELQITRLAYN